MTKVMRGFLVLLLILSAIFPFNVHSTVDPLKTRLNVYFENNLFHEPVAISCNGESKIIRPGERYEFSFLTEGLLQELDKSFTVELYDKQIYLRARTCEVGDEKYDSFHCLLSDPQIADDTIRSKKIDDFPPQPQRDVAVGHSKIGPRPTEWYMNYQHVGIWSSDGRFFKAQINITFTWEPVDPIPDPIVH